MADEEYKAKRLEALEKKKIKKEKTGLEAKRIKDYKRLKASLKEKDTYNDFETD